MEDALYISAKSLRISSMLDPILSAISCFSKNGRLKKEKTTSPSIMQRTAFSCLNPFIVLQKRLVEFGILNESK